METHDQYVPGVCNIGPAEISKRKQAGWIGLVATLALWALFIWLDAPAVWRLAVGIPAAMSAMGFLQAYSRFCAYFGFASLFNFGDVGRTDTVAQAEFRAKDRSKAWRIVGYSLLIGAIVALAGYLL